MKAVVLAYHNIGCVGIKALLNQGIEIAAVFTHTDDPNETVWFDSVAELASGLGIPVFAPDDINHPLWVEKISILEQNPDLKKRLGRAALMDTETVFSTHAHARERIKAVESFWERYGIVQ